MPRGFERINKNDGFAKYLRDLPLKPKCSKLELYTGGEANLQLLAYSVVDLPLISNDEQCADVCIRLRAEYSYKSGQGSKIKFKDVNNKTMSFGGGGRKDFEKYLRKVFGYASTFSLSRDLRTRDLK